MATKLYVVHGSHPCAAVEAALQRKGLPYRTVELPPPMHAAVMPRLFPGRTVPAIRFDDGEKVQGSRAIMRRLEELRPEPPLYGHSPEQRGEVEQAERWGDEVLQPVARTFLWPAFQKSPASMKGYQEGGKLPAMPVPVLRAIAPVATRIERKLNDATDDAVRDALAALPAQLDQVDAFIAQGVIGGEEPNAADFQIGATLRLLITIGDVQPLFEGRPAADLAHRWFSPLQGSTPAGLLQTA
ncbi:glutathione S-transferase [Conexibacter sp. SYSU D00693]|uniref:glutathione S-transferase n=1 Tax=Conexibacter sp. SYSU D00693 TaxID=2812560 RepID=UPI00196B95ED|nr:glutathione S-transferase [Conexibacter sp. SYSU D00693]